MEASASVLPEPVPPPTFKKPVPMTPPLTAFDPGYLARKAALPGKVFRLKNGNALEYFEEGSTGDPVVACFAAGGFNVSSLWTKEPVPGVRMIWVNQFGHGRSSALAAPVVFAERIPEIVELLDALGVDKFYSLGHSCGGVYAMQLAAALPERVLGAAILSSPGCIFHPSVSKAERKKVDTGGGGSIDAKGCWGGFVRSMMAGLYYNPDKSKDYGFAGHACGGYACYKSKAAGGAPAAMASDHWFVTKLLDAELYGSNSKRGLLYEMQGVWSHAGWSYDIAAIKCPCFLYVERDGEVKESYVELNQRLIPGAELVVYEAHGHTSIAMEVAGIAAALVAGRSFAGDHSTGPQA